MIRLLVMCIVVSVAWGCSGTGGGSGGGSGGGAGGGSAGGAGGGSAGGTGGGSAGGTGGGSAGGTGGGSAGGAGGSGDTLLTGIDATGGNTKLFPCMSAINLFAALPNGAFVATCTGTGYMLIVWVSTPANPMVFAKATELDRTSFGLSGANVNHAAYGILTLADNSVLLLVGDTMIGLKSLRLPPGGTTFEAPVTVAAALSAADRAYFGTPQAPGVGVLAFSDGASVKVARTTDGTTWMVTPGLVAGATTAVYYPSLRVDGAGNAYVVASASNGSNAVNVFGKATGATWSNTVSIATAGATYVSVSADGQKVVLHAAGKLWISTDNGATFPAAAVPSATSTELGAFFLSGGDWIFSDGSHGSIGFASGVTKLCTSANLTTWVCAVGPGDAHLAGVGFGVGATITASGSVWAAAAKGIGKLK